MKKSSRNDLAAIWQAGVNAVQGDAVVRTAIDSDSPFSPDLIVAVGKAAASMCAGALHCLPESPPAIVVVPRGQPTAQLDRHSNVTVHESSHPVPDSASLDAGTILLEAMREQGPDSRLLLLVSGGASALVEALRAGHSLDELQSLTVEWLAGGLSISQVNANRAERSRVKAGKLLREFRGSELRVYAISDVEGDDISIIGSGLGDAKLSLAPSSVKIVASNAIARDAAARFATEAGFCVQINDETLYGNVSDVAARIVQTLLTGEVGVYIWGGEPVVQLPDRPGIGGRNQSLALSIAMGIKNRHGISVIAAGSDGIDGTSEAAGGIVDSATVVDSDDARQHLEGANAGDWLANHGAAFVTGPTGTNVMDLVVAIVGNSSRA